MCSPDEARELTLAGSSPRPHPTCGPALGWVEGALVMIWTLHRLDLLSLCQWLVLLLVFTQLVPGEGFCYSTTAGWEKASSHLKTFPALSVEVWRPQGSKPRIWSLSSSVKQLLSTGSSLQLSFLDRLRWSWIEFPSARSTISPDLSRHTHQLPWTRTRCSCQRTTSPALPCSARGSPPAWPTSSVASVSGRLEEMMIWYSLQVLHV